MYVRSVKPPVWARLREDGEEAIAGAISELVRLGPKVSVYEVETEDQLELVAVALIANLSRQHFRYLEIEPADLEGISIIDSPGVTPLPDANRLHRDLDLGDERARLLVERLKRRRVSIQQIREGHLPAIARRLAGAGQPIPSDSWLLE